MFYILNTLLAKVFTGVLIININKKAILGKMNDDPVTFVFTNKKSYISIMLMGLVILIAQLIKL